MNNLQLPQSQSMGLAAPVWSTAVAPQQPQTLGNTGVSRQGLADLFFTAAANAGGSNGTIDFGIGKGMGAYANRLEHDRQQKAAYEQQLGTDKKEFLDQLRSKYTPESISDFSNTGMKNYSVLVELPRQFSTQKQTGSMVDGGFVAGEGDTYDVKYDQFGNVLGVAETAPVDATTQNFVDDKGDTYLWSVDPVTGAKIKNLGMTDRYVAPTMSATEFKAKQSEKPAGSGDTTKLDSHINMVDSLLTHKGRDKLAGAWDQNVGAKDSEGNYQMNPLTMVGSDRTDTFDALSILEQIESNNFLTAIQQMKGMGALSNAEGAKVQSAMAALRASRGDEKSFKLALERLKTHLTDLKAANLKESSSVSQPESVTQQPVQQPSTRRRYNPTTGRME